MSLTSNHGIHSRHLPTRQVPRPTWTPSSNPMHYLSIYDKESPKISNKVSLNIYTSCQLNVEKITKLRLRTVHFVRYPQHKKLYAQECYEVDPNF